MQSKSETDNTFTAHYFKGFPLSWLFFVYSSRVWGPRFTLKLMGSVCPEEEIWMYTCARTHAHTIMFLMTDDGPSHKTAKPSIQLAGGISHPMTGAERCWNRERIWIDVTILCDPCACQWAHFYPKHDKCNAPVSVSGKVEHWCRHVSVYQHQHMWCWNPVA